MNIDFSNPAHSILFCLIVLAWTGIGIGAGTDNNICSIIASIVMVAAILFGSFSLATLVYKSL